MRKRHIQSAPCCPTCGKHTTLYGLGGDTKPLTMPEAYRKRIRNLVAQFELEGYDTYERDASAAVALAQLMAVSELDTTHLESLLSHYMERITAAQFLETA